MALPLSHDTQTQEAVVGPHTGKRDTHTHTRDTSGDGREQEKHVNEADAHTVRGERAMQ